MHHPEELPAKKALDRRTALKIAIGGIGAAAAGGLAYLLGTRENGPMERHDDHGEETAKDRAWEDQEERYRSLRRLETGESLAEIYGWAAVQEAFRNDLELVVCCMDERVQVGPGQKKVAIAGSGILLSTDQLTRFVTAMRHAGRVVRVTSHEGCGACAMFCESKGFPVQRAEKEGQDFAARLTDRLNLPPAALGRCGYPRNGKPQPDFPMEGNPHFHHARNIVVDWTGRFRPMALPFPASFELSARHYPDSAQVLTELRAAVGIAFGGHGFGAERYHGDGKKLLVTIVHDPAHPTDADFLPALDALLREDLLCVMRDPSREERERYAGRRVGEYLSVLNVQAPALR